VVTPSSVTAAVGHDLTFCALRHVSKEGVLSSVCPCYDRDECAAPGAHGAWHRLLRMFTATLTTGLAVS
jgi:hypothetical protein